MLAWDHWRFMGASCRYRHALGLLYFWFSIQSISFHNYSGLCRAILHDIDCTHLIKETNPHHEIAQRLIPCHYLEIVLRTPRGKPPTISLTEWLGKLSPAFCVIAPRFQKPIVPRLLPFWWVRQKEGLSRSDFFWCKLRSARTVHTSAPSD